MKALVLEADKELKYTSRTRFHPHRMNVHLLWLRLPLAASVVLIFHGALVVRHTSTHLLWDMSSVV